MIFLSFLFDLITIKMNIFPCVNCPFVFLFPTNNLCPLPAFQLDCLILLIYRVCAMSFNLLFWEVGQIRECKICLYNHISYSYWRPTTALILVGGFPWPRPKRSPYPQGLTLVKSTVAKTDEPSSSMPIRICQLCCITNTAKLKTTAIYLAHVSLCSNLNSDFSGRTF